MRLILWDLCSYNAVVLHDKCVKQFSCWRKKTRIKRLYFDVHSSAFVSAGKLQNFIT
jgi:hypothetical protein